VTNTERIGIARQLMQKAQVEEIRKKETGAEIKKREGWIENAIVENPDKENGDVAVRKCRTWYKEIEKFDKIRSKQAHRAKNLRQASEDCIMGQGTFDAKQIDFSDIAENWLEKKKALEEGSTGGEEDPGEKEHVWKKTNLVTIQQGDRAFDTYKCERCGITGKKFGPGAMIIRDKNYAAVKYKDCSWKDKGKPPVRRGMIKT